MSRLSGLDELLVLVLSIGGFLGAIATIYRCLVQPVARAISSFLDALEQWRTVPDDVAEMKDLLRNHITQTDHRLSQLEWPKPYRRRETS